MYTKEELLSTNYFENNKYFNMYYELVSNKSCEYEKFKTHKHHILPRHYFKSNNQSVDNSEKNLIYLQFQDHMLAHLYLSGCTMGQAKYWNLYAIFRMSGHAFNDEQSNFILEIEKLDYYQQLYTDAINAAPNHRKGSKVSDATKERMRVAQRKLREIGGATNKGTVWVHNDNEEKMINPILLEEYLSQGYKQGRKFRHTEEFKQQQIQRNHNRVITDEFRQKMREHALRQVKTEETKQKNRNWMLEHIDQYTGKNNPFYGKHHSIDSLELNRQKHLGRKAINKDGIVKMVFPNELESYMNSGWKLGKK